MLSATPCQSNELTSFTIVLLDIWVPDNEKELKEGRFNSIWGSPYCTGCGYILVSLALQEGKGQRDSQREEKSWAGREGQRKILCAPGKETMGQGEGIKRTTSFSASHPCSLSYSLMLDQPIAPNIAPLWLLWWSSVPSDVSWPGTMRPAMLLAWQIKLPSFMMTFWHVPLLSLAYPKPLHLSSSATIWNISQNTFLPPLHLWSSQPWAQLPPKLSAELPVRTSLQPTHPTSLQLLLGKRSVRKGKTQDRISLHLLVPIVFSSQLNSPLMDG